MKTSETIPPSDHQIVINWDEGAMFNFLPIQTASEQDDADAATIRSMLEEIVDAHADARIDVLVHGVFSGFMCMMPYPRLSPPVWGGEHVPATAEEHYRHADALGTFWLKGLPVLAAAGIDMIDVIRRRCQQRGMKFVVGFRMNDRHSGSGQQRRFYPGVERMGRDHPEWLLQEFAGGLDYAYDGVRAAVLQFVAEAIERYDLDGIELDWMRWCHVFKTSEAAGHAPLLTDFTAKIRTMLDEAAERRGRERLLLGARVASTLDECTHLGYDVRAWIHEAGVDYLCPSDFYHTDPNCPVDQFVALTEGTSCRIYPSIHPSIAWGVGQRLNTLDNYRAAAHNFYAQGAAGVSPYNYMYHWGAIRSPSSPGPAAMWPKSLDFLTELRSADAVAGGRRHYLFHSLWESHASGHSPTRAYRDDIITLDRDSANPCGDFVFRLEEDLSNPRFAATLSFKAEWMTEADELEIRINGAIVPAEAFESAWRIGQATDEGRPLGPHFVLRARISGPPVIRGRNVLTARLLNRAGMAKRRIALQEFEVVVEPGGG